jgi:regulatory protein
MKNKTAELNSEEQAYNQAIKYLALRFFTVGELQERLFRRGFARTAVLAVLKRLEEMDFLNDRRYAEIFVENLKRYKDFGYFGIKLKLIHKKIPSDVVDKVLSEFLTDEEEFAIAERFVKKLKGRGRDSYEKIARSLVSKGFRTEIIGEVMREVDKK